LVVVVVVEMRGCERRTGGEEFRGGEEGGRRRGGREGRERGYEL
jgi:hypothetical protein